MDYKIYVDFLNWIDENNFVQYPDKRWAKSSINGKTQTLSFKALTYHYIKSTKAQQKVGMSKKVFDKVGKIIATYYEKEPEVLSSKRRFSTEVLIRYITYHILNNIFYHRKMVYVLAEYSKKDRTTIIHGLNSIKNWLDVDKNLQMQVREINTLVNNYLIKYKNEVQKEISQP